MPRGKLIAGFGIPGSGKSSVMKELGNLKGWPVFCEPEEADWAPAVHERDACGHFTALTWFRATRVPMLYEADRLRKAGRTVLIDTFYDKLVCKYLGSAGMEWLMSRDDPYFELAKRLADLDYNELPDCDCLVFFSVDETAWRNLLRFRNRRFDSDNPLEDSYHTYSLFLASAKEYCAEKNIKFIEFENKIDTPLRSAQDLLALLG